MVKYGKSIDYSAEIKTIVVGIKEDGLIPEIEKIVMSMKSKKEFLFKLGEGTEIYPEILPTNKLVLIGLGNQETYSLKDIQTVFAKVAKQGNNLIVDLNTFLPLSHDVHYLAEKASETIGLVNYEFKNYKTGKNTTKEVEITFVSTIDVTQDVLNGEIVANATNHARSLVNEPRNKLTPALLANYAIDLAKELTLEYKVYNKAEITELGMGAFLAVNQGSKEEAKLIHLKYRGLQNGDITALVGKGLTYDSGGYSIKSKDGMVGMKGDMGGAASVLGAIEIIARKNLPFNVDVIIAATENLISSEAIVPDDVIVTMSGKTIEILNTDAEGRLTLVDAVTFARTNQAKRIIDVATLTGGVVTALGTEITGVFTNNEAFLDDVKTAAKEVGEMIWQLPVDPFRDRCKKSEIADYNNSPGRDGHASFGAALIGEFALDTPWIHLDIAGTSETRGSNLLGPAGGTGVMVRTLAQLFELK